MSDFFFYFKIGWEHIITIEALDHILFIAALAAIYTLKDWKQVLVLVTAFTAGHTITLILSTKQWVEVSGKLVEFLIPCTIVVTAVSNLFQQNFTPRSVRINYFLALGFGLIHGLAFANTLRMILASDQSFALSMFSFSVGLELGQIGIVFLILLLSQLFIGVLKIERRHWVIFLSAAVFALALEMALQRWPKAHPDLPAGKAIYTQPLLVGVPATYAVSAKSEGCVMVALPPRAEGMGRRPCRITNKAYTSATQQESNRNSGLWLIKNIKSQPSSKYANA